MNIESDIRSKIVEARDKNRANPIGSAGFDALADAVEMILSAIDIYADIQAPRKATGRSHGKKRTG